MRNAVESDETLEDAHHALLHCCKRPHADRRALWESQMAQAMRAAQVVRRDGQGRRGGTIQWRDLSDTTKTKMALGAALPVTWESLRREPPRTLQELHEEYKCTTAWDLPDLCTGLRNYHLTVLQSLEAGDPRIMQCRACGTVQGTSPNRNQRMKRWMWHEKGNRKISTRD